MVTESINSSQPCNISIYVKLKEGYTVIGLEIMSLQKFVNEIKQCNRKQVKNVFSLIINTAIILIQLRLGRNLGLTTLLFIPSLHTLSWADLQLHDLISFEIIHHWNKNNVAWTYCLGRIRKFWDQLIPYTICTINQSWSLVQMSSSDVYDFISKCITISNNHFLEIFLVFCLTKQCTQV